MTQERKGAEVGARLGELLPQAELREEHHTQRKYQLPVSLTSLPLVFRWGSYCENVTPSARAVKEPLHIFTVPGESLYLGLLLVDSTDRSD